jgi:hypothetical protein
MRFNLVQISTRSESDFPFQSPMSRNCFERTGLVHRPVSASTRAKATGIKPSIPPKPKIITKKMIVKGKSIKEVARLPPKSSLPTSNCRKRVSCAPNGAFSLMARGKPRTD